MRYIDSDYDDDGYIGLEFENVYLGNDFIDLNDFERFPHGDLHTTDQDAIEVSTITITPSPSPSPSPSSLRN